MIDHLLDWVNGRLLPAILVSLLLLGGEVVIVLFSAFLLQHMLVLLCSCSCG